MMLSRIVLALALNNSVLAAAMRETPGAIAPAAVAAAGLGELDDWIAYLCKFGLGAKARLVRPPAASPPRGRRTPEEQLAYRARLPSSVASSAGCAAAAIRWTRSATT